MRFPTDLKYTRNDEWIRIEGDQGTVGITDYAQEQLSDIVFVETTLNVGDKAARGAACATIESVKAAAEVFLPVGGTVSAVNEALPQSPDRINSDPYGEAWILRLSLANPGDTADLLDAAAYEAYCKERSA